MLRWYHRLPIRVRLVLAYLLTLFVLLAAFATFVYFQVQRDLLSQVDTALELAAAQAVGLIDRDEISLEFEGFESTPDTQGRLDAFAVYLLDEDGNSIDVMGGEDDIPVPPPVTGTRTISQDGTVWRIYTEPVIIPERNFNGWVQTAQTLDSVNRTLLGLLTQLMIGIPLAILAAGLGSLHLARHALRPINQITHTARIINETDLSQRIDYDGPADEVGELAATFDGMLERLDAAFQRQLRFTADAAHELRTPLAALKARIGVTLGQKREVTEYTTALQDMEQQVDRLSHLTRELLYLARMDQGGQLDVELIDVADLLETILDIMSPLIEEKAITVEHNIDHDVTIYGDLDYLIHLFLNLLDNALKYTPTESILRIEAKAHQQKAMIAIQDSGPGIHAQHLPHLFERFYRVEAGRMYSANGNTPSGTGLGLAIANEIAHLHHGTIEVASTPGEGATFTVVLPQNQPSQAANTSSFAISSSS